MEWFDSIVTKSEILYLKTWIWGQRWSENFKLFLYNQCTQWEKLPTNLIHSIFQIPGCLINLRSDKEKRDNAYITV